MKIKPEVEIFDDPEYCATPTEYCPELYRIDWVFWCHQYAKHGEGKTSLSEDEEKLNLPVKCDQCKADFLKAKDKIITDNPAADWIDNKFGLDRWEFSRFHVGDAFNAGVVYQKAKQEDPESLKPCPQCMKPRGKEKNGALICPCPHCGDSIPF